MHHPTFQNSITQCQEEYPTLWVPLRGKTRERVPQKPLHHKDCSSPCCPLGFPQPFGAKESHSISQWKFSCLSLQDPMPTQPSLRCATPTALSPPHAHPSRILGAAVYPPDPVVSWTQGNPEWSPELASSRVLHASQTPGGHTSTQVVPLCPLTSEGLLVTKASFLKFGRGNCFFKCTEKNAKITGNAKFKEIWYH